MSLTDILRHTLVADAQLRENATGQLEAASQENFTAYTVMLCQELANESSQADVRTAAALALKNAMTARETKRRQELEEKWMSIDPATRQQIKQTVLQTLATPNGFVGNNVAQVVAAIAAIEVPLGQWTELINLLLENITTASDNPMLKRATLKAIGYVCESIDPAILTAQSSQILTAVVQGANQQEQNDDVRLAAINALYNSLEFVRAHFDHEGERNYLMQVVCEATQSTNDQVKVAAFETLVRIMQLYYDRMGVYMEQALFMITVVGMKSDNEQVALQAVEFWSTACDEEVELNELAVEAYEVGEEPERRSLDFAKKAMSEVLPVLLILLTKQDEDADDDEWDLSKASATCLALFSQAVGGDIVDAVLPFIEGNIRNESWRLREASLMAFGSIMLGPPAHRLKPLVAQAFPLLVEMVKDPALPVKDTAAWTLGRVCELLIDSINLQTQLQPLVATLVAGLDDSPKIVANCCWSLMNLCQQLADADDMPTSPLSSYYEGTIGALIRVGDRSNNEGNARSSGYEALSTFATYSPRDCIQVVSSLALEMLSRLETTCNMQAQIVNADDRASCAELQSNVCSVLTCITRRLGKEITPIADRLMTVLLQILQMTAGRYNTVAEDVFLCVSALTAALEADFGRYMESFGKYICAALQNQEEYQLCIIAVGLVGDVCRALGPQVAPYCDSFMTLLMQALHSETIKRDVKPAVLSCFGDIALAIGDLFETYLTTVMLAIRGGCAMRADPADYAMIDYINSVRDGILEAFVGITQGLKSSGKEALLLPYGPEIFQFLRELYADPERTSSMLGNMVGLLGDLAEAFPNGQLREVLTAPWVQQCLREARTSRQLPKSARDVARWAREMVKRASV